MKQFVPVLALGSAFLALPAGAQVIHQSSVMHDGRTVSVTYEPVFKTSVKQTGLGPRASAGCLWTNKASVQRKVADASGRPIAALTRVLDGSKSRTGMHVGYCRHVASNRVDVFRGDEQKLRAFVTAAANADAQNLRTELASLDLLRVADNR